MTGSLARILTLSTQSLIVSRVMIALGIIQQNNCYNLLLLYLNGIPRDGNELTSAIDYVFGR